MFGNISDNTQSAFTCSKVTTEILKQGVKYVSGVFIVNFEPNFTLFSSFSVVDFEHVDWENIILNHFSFDSEDLLKINELNADNSTQMYLNKINMLLDTYASFWIINKYKLKFKSDLG